MESAKRTRRGQGIMLQGGEKKREKERGQSWNKIERNGMAWHGMAWHGMGRGQLASNRRIGRISSGDLSRSPENDYWSSWRFSSFFFFFFFFFANLKSRRSFEHGQRRARSKRKLDTYVQVRLSRDSSHVDLRMSTTTRWPSWQSLAGIATNCGFLVTVFLRRRYACSSCVCRQKRAGLSSRFRGKT